MPGRGRYVPGRTGCAGRTRRLGRRDAEPADQESLPLALDSDGREVGRMRVSLERGLYRQVDVPKVARGRYQTERAAWLVDPVADFISARLDRFDVFLDPFAGEGHLLEVCAAAFGRPIAGYDVEPGRWPTNDSLAGVPRAARTMIVTNPPFLARHSARRKGVLSLARDYYRESGRDDLYQVALDRCRAAAETVVAIVPETFLLSDYPKDELAVLAVIEEPLFSDTDSPVSVACFDARRAGESAVFVGAEFVAGLPALLSLRPSAPDRRVRIRFNDASGRIGLRAVDGVDPADRIGFMLAADFPYGRESVKHSSRLMTYVEAPDVADGDLPSVLARANAILEESRRASRDLILAPFKGNNRAGVRRRRLDYAVARHVLAEAAVRRRSRPGPGSGRVATGGDGQGAADGVHPCRAQPAEEPGQPMLLDGLDVVQVDGGIVLEPLGDADHHLARRTADGGSDRRHHHGPQQPDDLVPAEHQDRSPLVGRPEGIQPELPPAYSSGHVPSSLQPASSAPAPASPPYASR
jgi:hypothetical protein